MTGLLGAIMKDAKYAIIGFLIMASGPAAMMTARPSTFWGKTVWTVASLICLYLGFVVWRRSYQ